MTTTTSIAKAILPILCILLSFNIAVAIDDYDDNYDFACIEDISIMRMDCMFALVGSSPCYGSYHIMYAPTTSDPYVSIGSYSSGTFYTIQNDGCYKLKKHCGNVCHESNVLVYSGCTSTKCDFTVSCPLPSVIEHCFDKDGHVSFDASDWVSGCSQVDYTWSTPIGTFSRAYIGGYHGYGTYKLTVTCHDQSCAYETRVVVFKITNSCATASCDFDVKWPLEPVIDHCYDTEGKVTIDAKPWVKGCQNATYKWITPKGSYHADWISGDYGYGTYKLEVTCHDASCYKEKKTYSFILKDHCTRHYFQMYCPDDVRVDCGAELWNLEVYGDAYYIYNGKKVWLKSAKEHHHLNECNRGYITREWQVKDHVGKWHKCEQTIYVGQNAYGEPNIKWPKGEIVLEGCNPAFTPDDLPYGAQKPYYENDGCSRFGHNYTDQVFYFNNTCKKVVRKWVVYDWCVYVPNSGSSKGKYTYHQTIKIVNSDEPIIKMPEDMKVSSYSCEKGRVDMEDLEVMVQSCGDKFDISHDSRYADKRGSNASGHYPIGKTTVRYEVKYGCGYTKEYMQYVTVENDKAPTPYCIESIVTPLMGVDTDGDGQVDDGMAEIWAKDFDRGTKDRCDNDVQFSFSKDKIEMVKSFSCDQLGDNEIKIYVSNSSGSSAYCVVNLTIQNNAANIPDCVRADEADDDSDYEEENEKDDATEDQEEEEVIDEDREDTSIASISGSVTMHYGIAVEDVSLFLYQGAENIQEEKEMTNTSSSSRGRYDFADLEMYREYMVSPQKLSEDSRFVTRDDSDRLYDHLSGRDIITDPYMLIAADIDRSGEVDFLDLSETIKLENKLWNEDADWVFINEGYEFIDESSPWSEDYNASHTINSLDDADHEANFIAIRLGDLVDSGSENDLLTSNISSRNRSTKVLVSPNPFSYKTTLSFNHEKTQTAQLVVYKINGEKVLDRNIRISKGNNEIDLSNQDLITAGVYIYSIIIDDNILKGKLLKLN